MVDSIFEFTDYRRYMTEYYLGLPKAGRGQLTKTAESLQIQPSLLTGILQGSKNLTFDQALDWIEYAGLTALEGRYFISLLHFERAGTPRARRFYQTQITDLKSQANLIKSRLPPSAELSELAKSQFYSQWYYSAIRLMTDLPYLKTPQAIAEALGLKRSLVLEVLDFLVENGLVNQSADGYSLAHKSTHVGAAETSVALHHTNWRVKAIESLSHTEENDLHFTSTLTLSAKDAAIIRKKILETLDSVFKIVDDSESEILNCISIDWFNVVSREKQK